MRRIVPFAIVLSALTFTGCSVLERASGTRSAARAGSGEERLAPLFDNLGDLHHEITTSSPLAQRYFDQGLTLTYGFNHAEAIRSFRAAAHYDPDCAMCYWGVAYALGPNINAPMGDESVAPAWEALARAVELAPGASVREQAYIRALAERYTAEPPADRAPLDRAYADAMREVTKAHPDDLDAQTLLAEALMDTTPWDYYRPDGRPKPVTEEITGLLESVLAVEPDHPGAIHFYIHAVEASAEPERAEAGADRLASLVPGAGHLVHMPSHIYYRVGRYDDAVSANEMAAAADESYISQCRAQGFYPALYYPHNIHFLYAAASEEGRSKEALAAAKKLVDAAPEDSFAKFPMLEEFRPVYLFALARFGRWSEILEEPAPGASLHYSIGMWRYARGMASVGTGHIDDARAELDQVRAAESKPEISGLVLASGSKATDLLRIAGNVLGAALAAAERDRNREIELLRAAMQIQDSLPYTEPPPWYFSVRQALGRALLRAGRAPEAERVYREDLVKHPKSGWALYGLAESLGAQHKAGEAAAARREFDVAWTRADVAPTVFYP